MARRVTLHSGRAGRSGVFRAGHNDRSEKMTAADHIDPEQSQKNIYRQIYGNEKTFEDAEKKFYRLHFGEGLTEKNERYLKNGHWERTRTIDDVYHDKKTGPEEVILQIGTRDQKIDPAIIDKIITEQIEWERQNYPQLYYLSYALHLDEPGAAPHVHARRVWVAHDKDGYEIPSERRALAEMEIERPDLMKKEGRYNNAKMTFTAKCREHLQELCKSYGLEIETEPREKGKSGRSLDQLKTETAKKELDAIRAETDAARSEKNDLAAEVDELKKRKEDLVAEVKTLEIRGNEYKMIDALEKAAKEKPITEGFIDKKIIGYKVSVAWVDESMRLARVGLQAADERAARERAEDEKNFLEVEKELAEKRTEAAEQRAADAKQQLAEKEKELMSLAIETLDFREASPELREKFSAAVDRERQKQREQRQRARVRTNTINRNTGR